MVVGLNCRLCGRSNTGGNLITYLDELTQDVYMTEDGYVFQNPYWHRKLIPSPEDFELLVGVKKRSKEGMPYWGGGLMHKSQRPDSAGKVILDETLPDGTNIRFDLQKFKYKWIFTDTILCRWPVEWMKWARESTYLLRPVNEDLPFWGWVRAAAETRYNNCYYEIDKENKEGKWKPMEKPPNDDPPETPSKEELDFLDRVWKLHIKYANEFTFAYEQERIAMYDDSKNYLNEVKNVVKEFATEKQGGTWDKHLKISLYKELRFLMELEMKKLEKHIEKKLDHTRKDFELFLPETFTRVNDEKLMIKMKIDYVYDWWPRTYSLSGLWQFSKRPLTKTQIEEWNEKDYGDKKMKEPLRTCVFCPSDSNKVGDDYAFDNWPLLSSEYEQTQLESEQSILDFNNEVTAWQIHDFSNFMADLVEDRETLNKLDEEQLKKLLSHLDKAKSFGSIAPEDLSSLNESERRFDEIFKDREEIKKYKDLLRTEREGYEEQANTLRTQISNLHSQIRNARDSNDAATLSRLEGELEQRGNEAAEVTARLGENNQQVSNMIEVVNSNTENNQRFREQVADALRRLNR